MNIGVLTSSVDVHRLWDCLHVVYVYIDCGSAHKLCRCTKNIGVLTHSVGVQRMLECSQVL